jgi:hypothetical protein
MTDTTDTLAEIGAFGAEASALVPHRFTLITALDDGTAIPPEALSEDHSVGLYGAVVPRKMRENLGGYREIDVADLVPQQVLTATATGARAEQFLEYVPLRGVRFRAERLQYLEEGWWATVPQVKYVALTVLGLLYLVKHRYGSAQLCLNTELPLPLWVRSAPLAGEATGVQAVVQVRDERRTRPTNIHTECPMAYARRWAAQARTYYQLAE